MGSLFKSEYRIFINFLRGKRAQTAVTQSELADLLGIRQSDVSKYEHCQKRLDIIEKSGGAFHLKNKKDRCFLRFSGQNELLLRDQRPQNPPGRPNPKGPVFCEPPEPKGLPEGFTLLE